MYFCLRSVDIPTVVTSGQPVSLMSYVDCQSREEVEEWTHDLEEGRDYAVDGNTIYFSMGRQVTLDLEEGSEAWDVGPGL